MTAGWGALPGLGRGCLAGQGCDLDEVVGEDSVPAPDRSSVPAVQAGAVPAVAGSNPAIPTEGTGHGLVTCGPFLLRIPVASILFLGEPFFPGQLSLSPLDILAVAMGVPVAVSAPAGAYARSGRQRQQFVPGQRRTISGCP